jgi:hypothetical protein
MKALSQPVLSLQKAPLSQFSLSQVSQYPVSSTRTQRLLTVARQKLLVPHGSPLLQMTAFLRLSCAALEQPGAYQRLIQALFDHNSEWWKTCEVMPEGTLQSSDPEIQMYLAEVLHLHFSCGL